MGNSTHATALREGEPQAKTDRQSATVKEVRSERAYDHAHQFPMGKVKIEKTQAGERSYEYQFPMGKVKGNWNKQTFETI